MSRPGMQFTIRRMLAVVAIAGLVFGCLAGLVQSHHVHNAYIQIGPSIFWSDSPVFWAIFALVLTVLVGLLVGFIAVMTFTAKTIRRRITRKT
jgi:uncharacterized protein HemY